MIEKEIEIKFQINIVEKITNIVQDQEVDETLVQGQEEKSRLNNLIN